jgi:dienelactone hydrolase
VRRWGRGRVIGIGLVIVLVVAGLGGAWLLRPQSLLPEAVSAVESTGAVTVDAHDDRITFSPAGTGPATGLILYPGGRVPPAAYAPAARDIAARGYLVVIVAVPFNLAVLGVDAAAPVIAAHPQIRRWAVGGHSLGGAMAAQFLSGGARGVDGLVLWAGYSAADLSGLGLRVAVIHGSLDAGAERFVDPTSLARLGDSVTITIIDGGNHEQMGWYTGQPNDPPATISREEQGRRVVEATVALLEALGN